MIGTQFIAKAHTLNNPCRHLTTPPNTPRNKKTTPSQYYMNILNTIPPPPPQITNTKHIHTTLTGRYLTNRPINNILHDKPPDIHQSEQTLARHTRVQLSQLRSGHHPTLNHYRHKINLAQSPACTRCNNHPDTTEHFITQCTTLSRQRLSHNINSVRDLWDRPVPVADYLAAALNA